MPSRPQRPRRPAPAPALLPRTQLPCGQCGLCCTYVTADIDPPNSVARASQIVWFLYHERVSVYWDRADDWVVQFETRCRFFADDRRCEVYDRRPHTCRDFDERHCEINAPDEGLTFHEPAQFLEWLAGRRPKLHAQLVERRLVPEGALLRRPVPQRKALAPFEQRYRQLRDAGVERVGPA